MATNDILDENPISMYELKAELEKIKKRDKELNFRSARTEEYLNQVAALSKKPSDLYEAIYLE